MQVPPSVRNWDGICFSEIWDSSLSPRWPRDTPCALLPLRRSLCWEDPLPLPLIETHVPSGDSCLCSAGLHRACLSRSANISPCPRSLSLLFPPCPVETGLELVWRWASLAGGMSHLLLEWPLAVLTQRKSPQGASTPITPPFPQSSLSIRVTRTEGVTHPPEPYDLTIGSWFCFWSPSEFFCF